MYGLQEENWSQCALSICVVGASGDLAKKKILPALFALYYENMLPKVGGRAGPLRLQEALLWAEGLARRRLAVPPLGRARLGPHRHTRRRLAVVRRQAALLGRRVRDRGALSGCCRFRMPFCAPGLPSGALTSTARTCSRPGPLALVPLCTAPQNVRVYGYARSKMSDAEFRDMIGSSLTCRIADA